MAGGDLLCQTLVEGRGIFSKTNSIDYSRLARAYVIGFCVISPNLYIWYNKLLPKLFTIPALAKKTPMVQTLVGTAFDQLIFAWSIIGQFFFFSNLLEVVSPHQTRDSTKAMDNMKSNIWGAMLANWTAWPFITFLNLRFVPRLYQVIVVNFCALFWNLYLAKVNVDSKRLAAQPLSAN